MQGPPLSNPTCLPTCIYFSYIYCIHHLPTSPTSYSTAHATTCPPLFLLTPGVHHTPRWPRLRRPASAPPRPAVKEPDNGPRDPDRLPLRLPQTPAKETYDFLPSSHFPCLASWIVCALARPLLTTAACDPPPRHCSSSPPSPPSSPLSRFLCLIPKVHLTRPKLPRPRLSHRPPARTCPPTSALANHSSLVLLPRPAAARHDPHAPAARCAATNAPPPRYALLPCALLATMQHASKTVDCMT